MLPRSARIASFLALYTSSSAMCVVLYVTAANIDYRYS